MRTSSPMAAGRGHQARRVRRPGRPSSAPRAQVTTPSSPATMPSAAAMICQKAYGYSWTSRSVRGSKAQLPPGKKTCVEQLEQWLEGDQPDDPDDHHADRRDGATQTDGAHDPIGSVAAHDGDRDADRGQRPGTEQQPQQGPRVAQVGDLGGVVERRAGGRLERRTCPDRTAARSPSGQTRARASPGRCPAMQRTAPHPARGASRRWSVAAAARWPGWRRWCRRP